MNLVTDPLDSDVAYNRACAQVCDRARQLFAPDVAVCATDPWDEADDLLPAEATCLPNAIPSRLREFAAGRRASHRAMHDLGQPIQAVLTGADRAPIWPREVTGSISHTKTICLAALARSDAYLALGLDIEEDQDLPSDIRPEVCTQTELAWLSVQPQTMRGRLARLIFSAKECAFKCQYPISKALFGFDMFEITPDLETGQFEATFTETVPGFPVRSCLSGRFAFESGLIITGMRLAQR